MSLVIVTAGGRRGEIFSVDAGQSGVGWVDTNLVGILRLDIRLQDINTQPA
jgi:hypothetical protein